MFLALKKTVFPLFKGGRGNYAGHLTPLKIEMSPFLAAQRHMARPGSARPLEERKVAIFHLFK